MKNCNLDTKIPQKSINCGNQMSFCASMDRGPGDVWKKFQWKKRDPLVTTAIGMFFSPHEKTHVWPLLSPDLRAGAKSISWFLAYTSTFCQNIEVQLSYAAMSAYWPVSKSRLLTFVQFASKWTPLRSSSVPGQIWMICGRAIAKPISMLSNQSMLPKTGLWQIKNRFLP